MITRSLLMLTRPVISNTRIPRLPLRNFANSTSFLPFAPGRSSQYSSGYSSYNAVLALTAGTAAFTLFPSATADTASTHGHERTVISDALGITAIGDIDLNSATATESESGAEFPTRLLENEVLLGTGCRVMRKLVRVYAVGVYVRPESIQSKLKPWQQFSASDMESATAVWDTLCSGDVGLVIRLTVVRQVGGAHMADGFERALKPRVSTYSSKNGGRPPKEIKKAVREFCDGFRDVGAMKVGSTAHIYVNGSSIELVIDGRVMREIEDPGVAWSVADMYLGENTVIPALRSDVARGIVDMLNDS